jgi:hypothetical protein
MLLGFTLAHLVSEVRLSEGEPSATDEPAPAVAASDFEDVLLCPLLARWIRR